MLGFAPSSTVAAPRTPKVAPPKVAPPVPPTLAPPVPPTLAPPPVPPFPAVPAVPPLPSSGGCRGLLPQPATHTNASTTAPSEPRNLSERHARLVFQPATTPKMA